MELIEIILNALTILSGLSIATYICKKQSDEYKRKRDKINNRKS